MALRTFVIRFIGALLLFVLLSLLGMVGYQVVEGWDAADGLYMAVITLTAVGYEEVRPLSDAGRQFTMVLLVGGLTWMGIWFALLTSLIVELDLTHFFRRRRIMRRSAGCPTT